MLCQFSKLKMNNFNEMNSHIESFYNDCSIIKNSISLTQDRNNIIENILNGQKYVVFDYIINKLTKKI